MKLNETTSIVKPILDALARRGYAVLKSKQTLHQAALILKSDRNFRGVAWRQNVSATKATYQGRERFIRSGVPGLPDIFVLQRGGRFVGLECKLGNGRLNPEQEAFQDICYVLGIPYFVVRSVQEALMVLGD